MVKGRIVSLAVILAFMAVLVGTALALHEEQQPSQYAPLEQTTLFVASDLHYLSPELTDNGEYFNNLIENGDGKAMGFCEDITDAFIRQVIEQKPDVLILSGDLTFNGEKASHTVLAEKLSAVKEVGIPVLVLPGNHDLENPMAASFSGDGYSPVSSINGQQFEEIYHTFGFEDAIARDNDSLSYVYELSQGLWILMLDVNTVEVPGVLKADTYQWAKRQLEEAASRGIRILTVSHQNILQHNSVFSDGYVIEGGNRLLDLYEDYSVVCNLSGHMHIQHIRQSESGLTEIASSSLMVSPNQYGVLNLDGNTGGYYTVSVTFPANDDSHSGSDIPMRTRTFLRNTAYRQAMAELPGEENVDRMSRFFADVNTAYISGRLDTVQWDDALFHDWVSRQTFLGVYLQSIYDDGFKNHTECSFIYY